jgi:DNA mismatch repair protein MutL
MDGYRQLLMKGRYPVCVLFLQLDSEMVDVNVHPTKHEVRFHDQRTVHQFVSKSVRDVLRDSSREISSSVGLPFVASTAVVEPNNHELISDNHLLVPVVEDDDEQGGVDSGHVLETIVEYSVAPQQEQPLCVVDPQPPALLVDDRGYFESLTIIGQYHRSYILCEDGDDLVLIDQHAAHERIGFERFKEQYATGEIITQELLFPDILELSIREDTELREQHDQMKRLGFELEHFGGLSWALKSIPLFLLENDVKSMVCDVLAELNSVGNSGLTHDAFDAVLIKMACHGMIRANQRLEVVEMKALLQQLDEVDFNQHCPHGRPILQRLRLNDVEKMFRRI